MNKANIDNPTAEDIAGWKEKHGEGKSFQITTEDGKATFYLKKPGRNDLDYASKVIDQGAFKFSEILMKNCWLGGSLEVFTNEDYFLEASDIMSEVVKRGKSYTGKALEAAVVDPADWMRISNAQLRYYLKIDPDSLTDDEWCLRLRELEYVRKLENGKE